MIKRLSAVFAAILLTLCLSVPVFADEYDYSFSVSNWTSTVSVDENCVYHVREEINAEFYDLSKHGIFRTLPTSGTLDRDGKTSKYTAKVSNIKVTDAYGSPIPFTKSNSSGNLKIKIGDADKTVSTYMSYIIEYDYDMKGDRLKDNDEIYFNFIGTSWPTNIDTFSYYITFPKEANPENVGVRRGYDTCDCTITSTSVSGTINNLYAFEGVSVRAIVPEDYFPEVSFLDDLNLKNILMAIVSGLFLVGSFMFGSYAKSKKQSVVEPIEVMPPRNSSNQTYRAHQLALIYAESPTEESILSILFTLANEGYLTITETGKKQYTFTKIKSYTGGDKAMRLFCSGLFSSGDVVTTKELKNKFYSHINSISSYEDDQLKQLDIFEEDAAMKTWDIVGKIISAIGFIATVASFELRISIVFTVMCALIGFSGLKICANSRNLGQLKPFFRDLKGKAGGFRKFMMEADKPRLELLINDNPNYFYDILPYAYALGVSDEYAKNFEGIAMEPPSYYRGATPFSPTTFVHGLSSGMNTMSSSPSSSSGGGSFSGGGGGGGGGGGSW